MTVASVASHTSPQPISMPKPLWSEQNPADCGDGIVQSIRAVLDATNHPEISAIGVDRANAWLVLLDAGGNVLRPSILWNDQRTAGTVRRDHRARRFDA